MTTLQRIELRCPVCDTSVVSQAVVTTNSFGGKRTDFHERAAGTQPLPYMVHTCTQCGYTGGERDFDGDEVGSFDTVFKQRLRAELTPRLHTPLAGSEKYELAALAAVERGLEPRHVGDLWLRAAWCCVDEGDIEAERFFRRKAAWAFETALAAWDGVAREERAVLTYLVGEVWRRVGDPAQAWAWFDRVPGEIVDQAGQRWVLEAARQQRDCPREWFS